jgi:hypothetical protein
MFHLSVSVESSHSLGTISLNCFGFTALFKLSLVGATHCCLLFAYKLFSICLYELSQKYHLPNALCKSMEKSFAQFQNVLCIDMRNFRLRL